VISKPSLEHGCHEIVINGPNKGFRKDKSLINVPIAPMRTLQKDWRADTTTFSDMELPQQMTNHVKLLVRVVTASSAKVTMTFGRTTTYNSY
jgi:hypothetical protein